MSLRNKHEIKALRRDIRAQEDHVYAQTCARKALSHIPREVASRVLTDPKGKLTNKKRKRFARSFATAVIPETTKPRDIAVKICVKLQELPLVGVIRLMKKSARRSASLKYMLAKLDPNSNFAKPLQLQQDYFLAVLKQATAEYNVRTQTT